MQTLQKAIKILDLFIGSKEEKMSISDLSRLSGINKSTVNRIAATLVKHGYLKQNQRRGKYSLGIRFLDFSAEIKSRLDIRDIAIPHLVRLSRLIDESIILAIWDGRKAVITETFHANHFLKVVPDEGTYMPLHSTAVGKMILTDMTDDEFKTYYDGRTLERHTPNTITDLDDLQKHLMIVKRDGFAFDDEEYSVGVRSISAALRDNEGNLVGSIGVLSPSVRLAREKVSEVAQAIKSCALEISRELGYKGE